MKPQPLPKISIPKTWSSAQALAIIDFLHAIADEIWDWYERPIIELLERRNQLSRDPLSTTPDQEIPF